MTFLGMWGQDGQVLIHLSVSLSMVVVVYCTASVSHFVLTSFCWGVAFPQELKQNFPGIPAEFLLIATQPHGIPLNSLECGKLKWGSQMGA